MRRHAPTLVLLLASYAFRFPALLNADSTNSDAAIVGLQAMHILRGEWQPFLWGSGYQSSVDSFVAAIFFAVLGQTPIALMLSALTLHVLATYLVFRTLARHLEPWTALFATAPLIFTGSCLHTYALYPPREASLLLAIASFCVIDAASRAKRPHAHLAIGAALAGVACYADPYPRIFLPLVALFAALVAWSTPSRAKSFGALAIGAVLGAIPDQLLRHAAGAKNGPMTLTLDALDHHVKLLVDECLPWALSYKVYFAKHVMDYSPWEIGCILHAFFVLAALLLAALVLFALPAALSKRIPMAARRLGFVGALGYPLATSAFSFSVMAMDHFSMRYLAAMILLTPFALVPAAKILGRKRFAMLMAPSMIATAIAGWVGYGPFVRGPLPIVPREIQDDYALRDMLRARGIHAGMADYWTAYRLTFLFHEEPIFVPKNESEDRYAPYRATWAKAPSWAYVFDPGRSRESIDDAEKIARANGRSVDRVNVGALTVFVVER